MHRKPLTTFVSKCAVVRGEGGGLYQGHVSNEISFLHLVKIDQYIKLVNINISYL